MVGISHKTLKALVESILLDPHDRPWTLQGLGMLRTYLTGDHAVRLHVWDPRYATPGASPMHTHPWDMVSTVVAGELWNRKFEAMSVDHETPAPTHMAQRIYCGMGGGLEGEPETVFVRGPRSTYVQEGASYTQRAHEIHISDPEMGTVTVVERTFGTDVDHAYVYWPVGTRWGSAEPRAATRDEVTEIMETALAWF